MVSLYRNAVAAFIALTYHQVVALNFHEQFSSRKYQLDKSRAIRKSDVAKYEKMINVDSDNKLFFYWNVDENVLDVQVVYKGLAWLGFGYTSDGTLDHAEAIIGKPEKPERNQVRKYKFVGDEWTRAVTMGTEFQTLKERSLAQDESSTTMLFKQDLKENVEIAPIIKGRGDNNFILVVGEKNNFQKPQQSYFVTVNLWKEIQDFEQHDESKESSTPGSNHATKKDDRHTKEETKKEVSSRMKDAAGGYALKNKFKKTSDPFKDVNKTYIIIASFLGGFSLLALMIGSLTMMEQPSANDRSYEPFGNDNDSIFYCQT